MSAHDLGTHCRLLAESMLIQRIDHDATTRRTVVQHIGKELLKGDSPILERYRRHWIEELEPITRKCERRAERMAQKSARIAAEEVATVKINKLLSELSAGMREVPHE